MQMKNTRFSLSVRKPVGRWQKPLVDRRPHHRKAAESDQFGLQRCHRTSRAAPLRRREIKDLLQDVLCDSRRKVSPVKNFVKNFEEKKQGEKESVHRKDSTIEAKMSNTDIELSSLNSVNIISPSNKDNLRSAQSGTPGSDQKTSVAMSLADQVKAACKLTCNREQLCNRAEEPSEICKRAIEPSENCNQAVEPLKIYKHLCNNKGMICTSSIGQTSGTAVTAISSPNTLHTKRGANKNGLRNSDNLHREVAGKTESTEFKDSYKQLLNKVATKRTPPHVSGELNKTEQSVKRLKVIDLNTIVPQGATVSDDDKTSSGERSRLQTSSVSHFVLDRSRKLHAKEIHEAAISVFKKDTFKVKRIVKPLSRYIRLSVTANLSKAEVVSGVQRIARKLEAKYREQSLIRRPDLECLPSGESRLSSVLSLNINGIKSKYNELLMLIQRRVPDIICLQETRKLVTDRRIHINGYIVHEVPSMETGLGLLIGVRKNSGLDLSIVESNNDMIIASVTGTNTSIIVGNVYKSPHLDSGKATVQRIANLVGKYSKKTDCLLAGD